MRRPRCGRRSWKCWNKSFLDCQVAGGNAPPIGGVTKSAHFVSLAVTSSVSLVPACGQNSLTPLLRLSPPRGARRGPLCENCARSLCSAFPHATRFAGLARGPRSVLPKRLRPQARVVGQPPHERRHLGRRQTGRTRKGYAASVSGKAANGCAVDGPREKNAAAGRSARARTSGRRRGKVGAHLWQSGTETRFPWR